MDGSKVLDETPQDQQHANPVSAGIIDLSATIQMEDETNEQTLDN